MPDIAQEIACRLGGENVMVYTLQNALGMRVRISNYGATILSIVTPDRDGQFGDIVLGYDAIESYFDDRYFLGATVGRFANRIGGGQFALNGRNYQLACNDKGVNHLHGGARGFHKALWRAEIEADALVLRHHSPDGDEGYPGALDVKLMFSLDDASLHLRYLATSDADTIVNLTNHSYFNLSAGISDVCGHVLALNADAFTPSSKLLIPTGDILPVDGTPMDFRTPCEIGARIGEDFAPIRLADGYDHNFALDGWKDGRHLRACAEVYEAQSGRRMRVFTDQPGVQFYTGNHLGGPIGRNKTAYGPRAGFCLETQCFPDAPNHPNFPSSILRSGETFASETIYAFSCD